jgi:hypothetical protein
MANPIPPPLASTLLSPGQPPKKKGFPLWLLLVLGGALFVVTLGGILAALAIHGFTRYLSNAKTAEAKSGIGVIARAATAAYEREQPGMGAAPPHRLCPSASRSVPASPAAIRGKKYMSAPAEWNADAARNAGFACLGFAMSEPQYFMYSYEATGPGAVGDEFRARANGDLDGDGVLSELLVVGRVAPGDTVVVEPTIRETNPTE